MFSLDSLRLQSASDILRVLFARSVDLTTVVLLVENFLRMLLGFFRGV